MFEHSPEFYMLAAGIAFIGIPLAGHLFESIVEWALMKWGPP